MTVHHQHISLNPTISNSAQTLADIGFTAAQIAGIAAVEITTNEPLRYSYDGSTPTASFGHLIEADDSPALLTDGDFAELRLIRGSASDATVTITIDTYERV